MKNSVLGDQSIAAAVLEATAYVYESLNTVSGGCLQHSHRADGIHVKRPLKVLLGIVNAIGGTVDDDSGRRVSDGIVDAVWVADVHMSNPRAGASTMSCDYVETLATGLLDDS
nr:hypothetical protein [Steroidobacter gossypii]